MKNVAVSEVLSHMEEMRRRIKERNHDSLRTIESMTMNRDAALNAINNAKIVIQDGKETIAWLDAEIDRMRRT